MFSDGLLVAQQRGRKTGHGPDRRWQPFSFMVPAAWVLHSAGKLYDTFSRVPISDQHFISADKMRRTAEAQRRGGPGPDVEQQARAFLAWTVTNDVFHLYYKAGYVEWADVLKTAVHFDKATFGRMPSTKFRALLRDLLPKGGATQRRLSLDGILEFVDGGP